MSAEMKTAFIARSQVFFDNQDEHEDFMNFIDNLLCDLPLNYADRFYCASPKKVWLDDTRLLLAECKLFRVTLVYCGSKFALNVEVVPNQTCTALAQFCLDTESTRVFDAVSSHYDLENKDRFWTSVLNRVFGRPRPDSSTTLGIAH